MLLGRGVGGEGAFAKFKMKSDPKLLLARAKSMRSAPTVAENRLWYYLRAHRFLGLKFKRQRPIGNYIVDFIAREQKLIVEVDGGQHQQNTGYDQQRDHFLRNQGFRVLRFWNPEVMTNIGGLLEAIRLAAMDAGWQDGSGTWIDSEPLSPDPSP